MLDPAFGFFVWIAHLVVIYVAAAVSCGVWLRSAASRGSSILVAALIALTLAAAALVILHGIRRYGASAHAPERVFMARIAVGQDAIAAFAILWQLIPILMSPVCR